MNKKNFIKLARLVAKFAEVTTDKGTLIYDGDLVVGTEVVDESAENVPDGEYTLEDGTVLVVEESKISEIKTVEPEPEPEPEETKVEDVPVAEEEVPVTEPATDEPIVPDEKDALIAELQTKIAEYEVTITELQNKIKELEDKAEAPAAEPVELSAVAQSKPVKEYGPLKYFK